MAKKTKSSSSKSKAAASAGKKPQKKAGVKPAGKPAAKPAAKSARQATRQKPRAPALGRPKVTGEELLFMLFHDDYYARQVFDFLRVKTVKELEQYSPQQIVKLLSRPITDAVDAIRRRLAEKNRHLLDDLEFAIEHQRASGSKN